MKSKKQIFIGLGGAGIFVLVLAGIKFFQITAAMAQGGMHGPPPVAVTSHVVSYETWPREIDAVGTLRAVQGSTLGAEEAGEVAAVHFDSGAKVKKDDVLLELDTSVEKAQLEGAEARLKLAEITAKRQRALRSRAANSQSDLDTAEANLADLKAEVARLEAVIERKQITAPFDGRTGIRRVNVGDMLSQGQIVVSLHSLTSLFLDFYLPQRSLGKLKEGDKVEITIDAYPETTFSGMITAIESQVDSETRNIMYQARVENDDELLRPGMYASVKALQSAEDKVLTVPASSIAYAPYGDTIWVIGSAQEEGAPRPLEAHTVKLGRKRGDRVEVVSGVREGQEVVSSGTFKLRPGAQVIVNNSVQPGNELQPEVKDT